MATKRRSMRLTQLESKPRTYINQQPILTIHCSWKLPNESSKSTFAPLEKKQNSWEGHPGHPFALAIGTQLDGSKLFQVVGTTDAAVIVILVESNIFKTREYLTEILDDKLLKTRANDCYCINYEDDALGLLQGMYAGLPKRRFEPNRHVATGYLKPPNDDDLVRDQFHRTNENLEPIQLISFRGALSHPVRKRLIAMRDAWRHLGPITHVDRWFNHSLEEKKSYWQEILESKFVLCPRGISPSSIRLFEVMELGRIPVIISDDWIPPKGPEWNSCSLIVKEARIETIPTTILAMESDWQEMAFNARQAWEQHFSHFSPQKKTENAIRNTIELSRQRRDNHN
jgi:hypothetical protein